MNQNFIHNLSLLLIAISCTALAILILPIAKAYLPANYILDDTNKPTIFIPKIGAYAPIILDVDPWTPAIYQEALKKGVAHAKGSSYPGDKGIIFIFAHSSGAPFEFSKYNTIFFRLNELKDRDKIILSFKDKEYYYEVKYSKTVDSRSTNQLSFIPNIDLILQTCTPPGTSLARLLVYASIVSP